MKKKIRLRSWNFYTQTINLNLQYKDRFGMGKTR